MVPWHFGCHLAAIGKLAWLLRWRNTVDVYTGLAHMMDSDAMKTPPLSYQDEVNIGIEGQLIALARRMSEMRGESNVDAERDAVREAIRTIGRTAAFFGGYDAMKQLHDAVEDMTGATNEIGFELNFAWSGIGGWWA